jgi:hypothetical protein
MHQEKEMLPNTESINNRKFHITILGRTLEHLGTQMYKRRDIAIAELVANSWDAGASQVNITVPVPENYDPNLGEIIISDNGFGMTDDDVEDEYLVVGRNRRVANSTAKTNRPIMGKKGIGKLAGFGLAAQMSITTWRDGLSTKLTLDVDALKTKPGTSKSVDIPGIVGPRSAELVGKSGTIIKLCHLKHKSPPDIESLRESLSRRFSRRVHGEMKILINGNLIKAPILDIDQRYPSKGYSTDTIPKGGIVHYYYAFTKSNIRSKELQGFTIYIRGKTAQAPPFYFFVESVASGLHWARYMTGEIEADFLDEGVNDEADLISTDRQEIDWADEASQGLRKWGEALTRKALREWAELKGERTEQRIMQSPEFSERIERLDHTSQKQVSHFLKQLGQTDQEPERALQLADSLIRAFEYRHFHDLIEQIEAVEGAPDQLALLLTHLQEWKVLESRAILEVIKGRLEVVEKFHSMIVNDAPETKSKKSLDNMHDLLAGSPWVLNPEWQVLVEEKTISSLLKKWQEKDIQEADKRLRIDFLALIDDQRLIVIEIKRSGHAVELEELQRLETYKEKLSRANKKVLSMVMICGGKLNVSEQVREAWEKRPDGEIRNWQDIYDRTREYYEHYRAILTGDITHPDFSRKALEVAQTRNILKPGGSHRPPAARKTGIGPQDRNSK